MIEMGKIVAFKKDETKLTRETIQNAAFAGNQNFKRNIDAIVELKDGQKNGKQALEPAGAAGSTNGTAKNQTPANERAKETAKRPAETEKEKRDYEQNADDNFGRGILYNGFLGC